MGDGGTTIYDALAVVAAILAVAAAVAVPLTSFARRPRLSLYDDREGIQSRVERGGLTPYVRLVVHNRPRRRAAQGTKVLVEHYHEPGSDERPTTMGSPALGWPSTIDEGEGAVIFSGGDRPIDFGVMFPEIPGDPAGLNAYEYLGVMSKWQFKLALAYGLELIDRREVLSPRDQGYVVRLLVGADDGPARRYDVAVTWDPDATSPETALRSVSLAVREIPRLRKRS